MSSYRSCVIAVIQREDGYILAGERSDFPGSWQLPQGGIEDGESPTEALFRELMEEIGDNAIEIENSLSNPINYDFPDHLKSTMTSKYRGQAQYWFATRTTANFHPNLEQSDGEFRALKWISSAELLEGIVYWKKEAYKEGLSALNIPTGDNNE